MTGLLQNEGSFFCDNLHSTVSGAASLPLQNESLRSVFKFLKKYSPYPSLIFEWAFLASCESDKKCYSNLKYSLRICTFHKLTLIVIVVTHPVIAAQNSMPI